MDMFFLCEGHYGEWKLRGTLAMSIKYEEIEGWLLDNGWIKNFESNKWEIRNE